MSSVYLFQSRIQLVSLLSVIFCSTNRLNVVFLADVFYIQSAPYWLYNARLFSGVEHYYSLGTQYDGLVSLQSTFRRIDGLKKVGAYLVYTSHVKWRSMWLSHCVHWIYIFKSQPPPPKRWILNTPLWTSHFLQGTRKTWPCLTGHPVSQLLRFKIQVQL